MGRCTTTTTLGMAQMALNDKKKEIGMFDPTKFGGRPADEMCLRNGRTLDASTCFTIHRDGKLRLMVSPENARIVIESLGVEDGYFCICPVEREGALLVWKADDSGYPKRKLSKCFDSDNTSSTMSVEVLKDAIVTKFGEFKHIYLDVMPIDGGRAFKLMPNGRRD